MHWVRFIILALSVTSGLRPSPLTRHYFLSECWTVDRQMATPRIKLSLATIHLCQALDWTGPGWSQCLVWPARDSNLLDSVARASTLYHLAGTSYSGQKTLTYFYWPTFPFKLHVTSPWDNFQIKLSSLAQILNSLECKIWVRAMRRRKTFDQVFSLSTPKQC